MTGTVRRGVAWTTENVEKLKSLWEQRLSASQVASQIPGATRNAIIGKVHRLRLPPKTKANSPTPNKISRKAKRKAPMVLKQMPVPRPVIVNKPPTGKIEFINLGPYTCRSVEGYSPQNGHNLPYYCSNLKSDEESFCAFHRGIYYRGRYEDR